jgi:hypothetical protein
VGLGHSTVTRRFVAAEQLPEREREPWSSSWSTLPASRAVVQGHRDVQSLAARGRLHHRDHPEIVEQVAHLEGDAAGSRARRRARRVEIEHHGRGVDVGKPPLVRVQARGRRGSQPHERREVLDDGRCAVTALGSSGSDSRTQSDGAGAALLEEPLTLAPSGAHEGRWPAGQVGSITGAIRRK